MNVYFRKTKRDQVLLCPCIFIITVSKVSFNFLTFLIIQEVFACRCSVKKVFLKSSQNSQRNACTDDLFKIKLQAYSLQLYLKRDSGCFAVNFAKFLKKPNCKTSGNGSYHNLVSNIL